MKHLKTNKILKSDIITAVSLNIIFLILALLFCDIKYEVSDDFVMASIMSGAYDNGPNPHMIFVNVLLGYIFLPFYKIFPQISWYLVFQLFLCFCSFAAVTYMLLKRLERPMALMLSIMFITFFGDDVYVLPQFTKTAALAVMSGAVVFLWAVFYKRKTSVQIIAAILCFFGSLVRFNTIYLAGGFILLILLFELGNILREKKQNWKDILNKLKRPVISGMLLIVFAAGADIIDNQIYNSDAEYQYFVKYNSVRAEIVDQPDYGYARYEEQLKEIGVSENGYLMLRSWNFGDDSYFSLDLLEQVADIIQESNSQEYVSIRETYESMQGRGVTGYPVFHAGLILFVLTICFNRRFLWTAGICAVGLALETYFFLIGRVVYRVEYGIFVCVFLGILYFWCEEYYRKWTAKPDLNRIALFFSVFFIVLNVPLYVPDSSYKIVTTAERKQYIDSIFYNSWDYDARKYRNNVNAKTEQNGLLKEIEENEDNFYFLDFTSTIQSLYYEWNPFTNLPIGYYKNVNYLGGVTANYPSVNHILDERGINPALPSLVEEGVYLVDNSYGVEMKLNYLREHYYPDARAELYKEIDGYQIWKVVED